jgi:hypothetical protein
LCETIFAYIADACACAHVDGAAIGNCLNYYLALSGLRARYRQITALRPTTISASSNDGGSLPECAAQS